MLASPTAGPLSAIVGARGRRAISVDPNLSWLSSACSVFSQKLCPRFALKNFVVSAGRQSNWGCHRDLLSFDSNVVNAKIYYDSNSNNDLNSNSPTISSFLNNFAQKKGEKHNLWKHRQSFLKRSKVTRLHKCCDLVLTQLDNFVVLFLSDDI